MTQDELLEEAKEDAIRDVNHAIILSREEFNSGKPKYSTEDIFKALNLNN
jgi:hypothetical protein